PGPYTSPLSSSLSAVVADSIRRRVRIRPRRSSTRQRHASTAAVADDGATPSAATARSRGNSEPLLDEQAMQLAQALTSQLDATPSRRRRGLGVDRVERDGVDAGDDDDDDDEDDVLRSGS